MSTEEGCPIPSSSSFITPEKTIESNIKREFLISLTSDESIKYLLEIEQKDKNIILFLKLKEENISSFTYQKTFTLESLRNISKLFRLYDSISEVLYFLFEELENNKQILKFDKNSNILLIFSFQIPGAKSAEEIILCLEKNHLKNEELNNFLIKEIFKMKQEIRELKEENQKLKKEKEKKDENNNNFNIEDKLEEKIQNFKNEVNNQLLKYENEINNLKEIINKNIKNINHVGANDVSKFLKIIKENIPEYKNKNIQMNLIYNANKDGQNHTNCHSKCNNIPNTFSLITTSNNIKFGFFRSIAISGQGPWKIDNKAFFISLDKNKIYPVKTNQCCVAFDNSCFIQTRPFTLIGNILNDKYFCPNKSNMSQFFEDFTEDYELNGGERDFYVKKFEVYQLNF